MLIFGRNPVLEALRAGTVERLFAADGIEKKFAQELESLARQQNLELEWLPRIELDRAVKTTQHQGVLAQTQEAKWSELEDCFAFAKNRDQEILLLLLDGITDPHNFGAIIRSAEVLGAHGVIVEERRSAPLSATVIKASAGATAHLPLVQVKNLVRCIEELKEKNVWIYGAAGEAEVTLAQLDVKRPLALVIGSEGEGMRRLVREHCDELVRIETVGKVQSLNASVAAAILIYETQVSRAQNS